MRRPLSLLLTVVLPLSAGAQGFGSGAQANATGPVASPNDTLAGGKSLLKFKYDKITDTTFAWAPAITWVDSDLGRGLLHALDHSIDIVKPTLRIQAAVVFDGKVKAPTDTVRVVYMVFTLSSLKDAHNSVRSDANAPDSTHVRLLLDDSVRFNFVVYLKDKDLRFAPWGDYTENQVTQIYEAAVSTDVIRRIAGAQIMEGKILSSTFKFKRKYIQSLTAVQELFPPTAVLATSP